MDSTNWATSPTHLLVKHSALTQAAMQIYRTVITVIICYTNLPYCYYCHYLLYKSTVLLLLSLFVLIRAATQIYCTIITFMTILHQTPILTSHIKSAPVGNLFLLGIVKESKTMGCSSCHSASKTFKSWRTMLERGKNTPKPPTYYGPTSPTMIPQVCRHAKHWNRSDFKIYHRKSCFTLCTGTALQC